MKRTNIRPISNIEKKAITVTGTLFLPLRIGERAWIFYSHTYFHDDCCGTYSGSIRKLHCFRNP